MIGAKFQRKKSRAVDRPSRETSRDRVVVDTQLVVDDVLRFSMGMTGTQAVAPPVPDGFVPPPPRLLHWRAEMDESSSHHQRHYVSSGEGLMMLLLCW